MAALVLVTCPIFSCAGHVPPDGLAAAEQSAALYARGDLDAAVRVLLLAIEREPQDPQLHFMLGNALFRQRKWSGAAQRYSEAARLRPDHPDTYLALGHALFMSGRPAEAVVAWDIAVSNSPYDALPRLALAVGLAQQSQTLAAADQIALAVALGPDWRQRISIDVRWTPEMVRILTALAEQVDNPNREQIKVTTKVLAGPGPR